MLMKFSILLLLSFLCSTIFLNAQTTVPEGIARGTWAKNGSPYTLTGVVTVPLGDSLKIESGVKVRFSSMGSLSVKGRILAKGTVSDSIEFSAILPVPDYSSVGVFIDEVAATTDSTLLNYCSFTTQAALSIRNCPKFKVDNCRFSDFDTRKGGWINPVELLESSGIVQNCTFERMKNGSAAAKVWGGNLIFRNCIFRQNSNSEASGIHFIPVAVASKPVIEQCTFTQNTTKVINISNSYSAIFRNNIFDNNTVDAYKGMIFVDGQSFQDTLNFSTNTFKNNTIVSNLSNFEGGTVLTARGFNYVNFNGDIFENNKSGKYQGGAVYVEKGVNSSHISTLNMTDCRFHNNSASKSIGGAIYATQNTSLFVNRCIFTNNHSETGGAIALYNLQDPNLNFSIKNSLFANNEARDSFFGRGQGGAIWIGNMSGKSHIYNTTFANNYAPQSNADNESGGALCMRSKQLPEIVNCIFKGNNVDAGKGKNIAITEGDGFTLDTFKISYCSIEGGQNSLFSMANFGNYVINYGNNTDSDPQFTTPSTVSGLSGDGKNANFRLKRTSSAINKGTPTINLLGLGNIDLDLKTRVVRDTIDIGPYEVQAITTPEVLQQTQTATSVCAGIRVVFRITAQGANPLTYKWLRNNVVLSSTVDSLVVTAAISDTGKYICQLTNSFGTVNSTPMSLNVDTVPKLTLTILRDSLCQNGAVVTLVATPAGGIWSGVGIADGRFTPATAGVGTQRAVYTFTTNKGCVGRDSMPIIVRNCRVGITEALNTEGVSAQIFPNPSQYSDVYLTIKSIKKQSLNVDLYAIDGRFIKPLLSHINVFGEQTFTLSPLAQSGIFILRIRVGETVLMQKIMH